MNITSKHILFGVSVVCIVIGGLMSWLWHPIFNNVLKSQLQLSEDSKSFNLWKATPIPMYIELYVFNCTNSEDVLQIGYKPHLVELGPYVFSEEHSKVNITWNDNQTITFNQIRRWKYLPELSNGFLDDVVVNLNVISLAVAYMGRTYGDVEKELLNMFINTEGSIWMSCTVGELLFDGCDINILDWIIKLESFTHIHLPFKKFGWFYGRNNSWSYDGTFNMQTGVPFLKELGIMNSWNYYNRVPYYNGHCGDVNGTAGELWPPKETGDSITMFVSDLCRSITLDFENEASVHGVVGRKFSAGKRVIANGTENPDNSCFCQEECFPSGVFDVSECKYGAPAFISYPNFYLADEFFLDKVGDMKPNKDKHEFQITLEPNTGIPLNVSASLQINLHLQPQAYSDMYNNVTDLFMPMLWFSEKASIPEDLSSQIKMLLIVPVAGTATFFAILGFGVFLGIVGILITIWKRRRFSHSEMN